MPQDHPLFRAAALRPQPPYPVSAWSGATWWCRACGATTLAAPRPCTDARASPATATPIETATRWNAPTVTDRTAGDWSASTATAPASPSADATSSRRAPLATATISGPARAPNAWPATGGIFVAAAPRSPMDRAIRGQAMVYRRSLATTVLVPVVYSALRPWAAYVSAALHRARLKRLRVNRRTSSTCRPSCRRTDSARPPPPRPSSPRVSAAQTTSWRTPWSCIPGGATPPHGPHPLPFKIRPWPASPLPPIVRR